MTLLPLPKPPPNQQVVYIRHNLTHLNVPNKDNPILFNYLFDILEKSEIDNNIIVGDWNLTFNQDFDTLGFSHKNNPNATDIVNHQIIKRNLVDIC